LPPVEWVVRTEEVEERTQRGGRKREAFTVLSFSPVFFVC